MVHEVMEDSMDKVGAYEGINSLALALAKLAIELELAVKWTLWEVPELRSAVGAWCHGNVL